MNDFSLFNVKALNITTITLWLWWTCVFLAKSIMIIALARIYGNSSTFFKLYDVRTLLIVLNMSKLTLHIQPHRYIEMKNSYLIAFCCFFFCMYFAVHYYTDFVSSMDTRCPLFSCNIYYILAFPDHSTYLFDINTWLTS